MRLGEIPDDSAPAPPAPALPAPAVEPIGPERMPLPESPPESPKAGTPSPSLPPSGSALSHVVSGSETETGSTMSKASIKDPVKKEKKRLRNFRVRKECAKVSAIRAAEVAAAASRAGETVLQRAASLEDAEDAATRSSVLRAEADDLLNQVLQAEQQLAHEKYSSSLLAAERLAQEAACARRKEEPWRHLHPTCDIIDGLQNLI